MRLFEGPRQYARARFRAAGQRCTTCGKGLSNLFIKIWIISNFYERRVEKRRGSLFSSKPTEINFLHGGLTRISQIDGFLLICTI
jgi:hypothetical protein